MDETWIDDRLGALSPDEKAAMAAGADAWHTVAVPRLGISAMKVTDGPNGARGDGVSGARAACFPVGSALGATWNPDLLEEVGAALAVEARSKGAHILLGPTVNIHRSPLGGRNFECYSEDPFLTARLAVGFVDGLQGEGVGACIKHYVGNESEFERMTISSQIPERALREIYLLPFEMAVAEARPWSIMGAYNRVDGEYACANRRLLIDILKEEWGFDGLVVSDWGAVHDTVASAVGGCDLEMPGPPRFFGAPLARAVEAGNVDAAVVEDKVRRLLRTLARAGLVDPTSGPGPVEVAPEPPEQSLDLPEHRALARRAAAESIVLLQNRPLPSDSVPVLPLTPTRLHTLAVIGPNAEQASIMGGGSSQVRAHHQVHPLAAITERLAGAVRVAHAPGGTIDRYVPDPEPRWFAPLDDGGRGLRVRYFATDDVSQVGPDAEPFGSRLVRSVSWVWWFPPEGAPAVGGWGARWEGTFVPDADGPWRFGLAAVGRCRLLLDGEVVVDNWTSPRPGPLFFGSGTDEVVATADLDAGRSYGLRIDYQAAGERAAIRFGATAPVVGDPIADAVDVAAAADAAVVVVGTDGDWETEGADRPSMGLPGRQDELVAAVAAAIPRTVVVLNTGSPVEMPWVDDVPAVLQAWFGGQEAGDALADVLFGAADPGGRLPTTFPQRYEDNPTLFCYPGENGEVRYGEGLYVGYRAYDRQQREPLFAFGHGLSYTDFEYGDVEVVRGRPAPPSSPSPSSPSADGTEGAHGAGGAGPVFEVAVPVTNVGERPGFEVVQAYVRPPPSRLDRPLQELKGFAKVALDPGATAMARIRLDARSFAYYDDARCSWVVESGRYVVALGSSSRRIRAEVAVTVESGFEYPVGRRAVWL